jgi:hypothetical protein
MINQVFKATCDHPLKNDFVQTYLKSLNIDLTFEEIREMSEYSFKKYVKTKTREAAFKHLMELKNMPGKQTKMYCIFRLVELSLAQFDYFSQMQDHS